MRHTSLVSFLERRLSAADLWKEIEAEVVECLEGAAKEGVGYVVVTDGNDFEVTSDHVSLLLAALRDGLLPLKACAYVADALIFSDDFDWDEEAVAEVLFFLSDESRPITMTEIEQAQALLASG